MQTWTNAQPGVGMDMPGSRSWGLAFVRMTVGGNRVIPMKAITL